MTKNVGTLDRALRIAIGIAVLALYFVLPDTEQLFALIGVVPLATAFIRWCPLYTLVGIRTCPADSTRHA